MNAHNEQQPAAAQEVVAFRLLYKMHGGDWSTQGRPWADGKPDPKIVADAALPGSRWKIEYAYAAPVTAAPADHLHAHLLHMLGAKDHEDAGRIIGELHAATMRTPAAPVIDIEHFHRAVQRICIKFDGDLPYISGIAEVLDLIDASPKGDAAEPLHAHYCNAQPASAECICGLDNPKGGSETREALRVAYRHLDVDSLRVSHRNDLAIIESAMHPQAGDAEVQP